jgi:hypothetical protein
LQGWFDGNILAGNFNSHRKRVWHHDFLKSQGWLEGKIVKKCKVEFLILPLLVHSTLARLIKFQFRENSGKVK